MIKRWENYINKYEDAFYLTREQRKKAKVALTWIWPCIFILIINHFSPGHSSLLRFYLSVVVWGLAGILFMRLSDVWHEKQMRDSYVKGWTHAKGHPPPVLEKPGWHGTIRAMPLESDPSQNGVVIKCWDEYGESGSSEITEARLESLLSDVRELNEDKL